MIPKELKYSIEINDNNFSISVSDKLLPLVKTFSFNADGEIVMFHYYPGDQVVVTISGKGSTKIFSNAKLTKTGETSVDVDI